ncbi:MAG: hypothetical protein RMK29_18235 [Myxococcales bacterium]|nr:hypothetical protein [Myxococcota bacterium]MDW8283651.1 hypothetical protein [Myxococcales bacterium]
MPTALWFALLAAAAPTTGALPPAAPPQLQDRQQGGRSADPMPLQPTPVRVRPLKV